MYETNKQRPIQNPKKKKATTSNVNKMIKIISKKKKKDKFFILPICFAGIVTESGQQHFWWMLILPLAQVNDFVEPLFPQCKKDLLTFHISFIIQAPS